MVEGAFGVFGARQPTARLTLTAAANSQASALADCSDHLLQLLRSWDELPAVSGGHSGCFAKKPLHYDTKKILMEDGLRDKKCRCIE